MKRKIKKLFLIVFMMFCITFVIQVVQPVNVEAANILIPQKYGEISCGKSKIFEFSIPLDSTITVKFQGMDYSSGYSTYGECTLNIVDSSNSVVYSKRIYSKMDDVKVSFSLKKGTYKLKMISDDYQDFEYVFSVTSTSKDTSFKLDKNTLNLSVGKSKQINAIFNPPYATSNITWISSNKKIATVNRSGKVTAKAIGATTIIAKCDGKTQKCSVYVQSTYVDLKKGKTYGGKSIFGTIKNYQKGKFASSNASVASVGKGGTIVTKSVGKTTISAKIGTKTYKCVVYVYDEKVLEKKAIIKLKSVLKNPNSLIVNKIYRYNDGSIRIDYSAMNGFGGYNRDTFLAWYDKGKFGCW